MFEAKITINLRSGAGNLNQNLIINTFSLDDTYYKCGLLLQGGFFFLRCPIVCLFSSVIKLGLFLPFCSGLKVLQPYVG